MKVGIITIIDYNNYGNRLQNYATQEVLKSLGCEPVTIVNTPKKPHSTFDYIIKIKKLNLILLKKVKNKLFLSSKEKEHDVLKGERKKAFKEFTQKYIIETDYEINRDYIPENLGDEYEYFITGSDQVWNPHFRGGSPIDFLVFAPQSKRIAYAASFGITELPEKYIDNYKLWLSQMVHISVREEAGADIIKKVAERDAEVLIDPTLMLNKDKWLAIANRHRNKPNKPYLLTYFLGEVSPDVLEFIKKIKQEKKLEVISMADINDALRYSADPGEFLDYINSSEIIITDSFHGAVFSILFERPFIVCDRVSKTTSMSSRIETLLNKFKLEERKWENIRDKDNIFDIDFSHIPGILDAERKKSFDYLKNALNIKDED